MGKFNEELVKAGVMLAGEGLQASSKGARVRFSGSNRTVIDGPFPETKELIAGYWMWRCKSLAEAIDWVKRCPNPHNQDCEIEIRQVFEPEDFCGAVDPTKTAEKAVSEVNQIMIQKITPFLWFDSQAEDAAKFYTSIFRDSKMGRVTRYPAEGREIHGREPGSVMVAEFQIEGQTFTALNGGPLFKFNESISFVVHCESQEEVDHYWNQLSAGGDPKAQQCGWLKDKFGVSWQIVPNILLKMLADDDREKANRVMRAMLGMKKMRISELEQAYGG